MRRNSGIIGARLKTLVTSASGLFDTFDNYISRRDNSWPATIYYNSTSFNSGTINENTSQSITLNTQGILVNTTFFWTILHGNSIASDFNGNVVSGSFVQSSASNTGTFSVATAFTGNTSKTPKTFQIQIRTGSTGGPVVYTTGTYTIPTITVSNLYWSPTSINENASSSLFFQCGNCGTNTTWNLTLTNTGTISASDISGGLPTTWTINPGVLSSRTYTTLNDFATEGTETLSIQVSFAGFNLGTAQTLTVNDTSLAPTSGTITPSTTTLTEGNTVTFTCTMNNSYTGTAYYTINNVTGTMSTTDFSDVSLSGSFSMSNGSGSFNKKLVADGLTEGEAFSVSLRYGSTTGTIFATTTTISTVDMAAPVQEEFTTPGTYSWLCPTGVTSVCVVCIGGGGGAAIYEYDWNGSMSGGAGGGLAWKNNISVTPGNLYTVVVGAAGQAVNYQSGGTSGGQSYFINTSTVYANGGGGGRYYSDVYGGSYFGDGGGNGGNVFNTFNNGTQGGGGAGGYTGNGGNGGVNNASYYPTAGAGGGGAGGGNDGNGFGWGGGGTGILGQGTNGSVNYSGGGGGGSGGGTGSAVTNNRSGGLYGGGGGGVCSFSFNSGGNGATGAVRIIWGAGRSFPSTNTGNL
jgi:hypothetical protein